MKKEEYYRRNPETLQFEKVVFKNRKIWPVIILAFFILGFGSVVKINNVFEKVPVIVYHNQEKCTPENVKKHIKKLRLKFPKIVYQQVMVESHDLKSPLTKSHNNIIGMENALLRPTLGNNVGTRFADYDTWQDCLVDYAIWQMAFAKRIETEEEYYDLLDRLYCSKDLEENKGPLYSTRLKTKKWETE